MKRKGINLIVVCLVSIFLVMIGVMLSSAVKNNERESVNWPESISKDNEKLSENIWKPEGLKVELMEEPYGIDTKNPAFSWYVNGKENNVYQKMYQIVFSKTLSGMKNEIYVLDTGWCESEENTYVKLEELEALLDDNSVYYWKVRIKDGFGNISEWSDIASFSTEVGNEWVSTDGIWCEKISDYAFFRSEIYIEQDIDNIEKALLSVTALSPEEIRQYVYNIYMNGQYIGTGPARLKDNKVNYNTFDITQYLEQNNVLGAICYTNTEKLFLCQITLFYKNGTKQIVSNSGRDLKQWKVLDGDKAYGKDESMISTPYYVANAENINAFKYPEGWLEQDYNDSKWKNPIVNGKFEVNSLVPYQTENMQKDYITPVSIKEIEQGHYLVDLGKEIIGGIAINVFCKKIIPTHVILRYGEELDDNGNVKYQMRTANVYEEKWTLKFGTQQFENVGMKTFRYIEIYADNITLTQDSIRGVALRQPFLSDKSEFDSSNELLNDIYDLTKYTIQATNQNLYVDSQSRERGSYEGDTWINMMASYAFEDNYTLARVSSEYLYAGRTWPAEYPMYAIMCAWQDYMYTGNIDSLNENYEILVKNMQNFQVDELYGLIKNDYGEDGFNRPLVDWPENERDGFAYDEAEYNAVVNAVACVAYKNLAQIANTLDDKQSFFKYNAISDTIKNSMISYLYNEELGKFSDGLTEDGKRIEHYAQHATAYALYAEIYDDLLMKEQLIESLKADGIIKTSVFSSYFLLQGLYDNDAGEYATDLLLMQEDKSDHTWAYMLRKDNATITTEAWNPQVKDNMTYSHPWGASPACFITNGIFGIKPIKPGFKEFEIKLQPNNNINKMKIKTPTIKGKIEVSYELKNNGTFSEIRVFIPSNTTAYLMLPINRIEDKAILKKQGFVVDEDVDNYYSIPLNAGEYVIQME